MNLKNLSISIAAASGTRHCVLCNDWIIDRTVAIEFTTKREEKKQVTVHYECFVELLDEAVEGRFPSTINSEVI
jgi:hypothetical protein